MDRRDDVLRMIVETFIETASPVGSKSLIEKYSVASKEVALEMVKKGKEIFNSDIVISFTGEAGPISNTNVPPGTVFIGIIIFNEVYVYEKHYNLNRNELRDAATDYAFEKILEKI